MGRSKRLVHEPLIPDSLGKAIREGHNYLLSIMFFFSVVPIFIRSLTLTTNAVVIIATSEDRYPNQFMS